MLQVNFMHKNFLIMLVKYWGRSIDALNSNDKIKKVVPSFRQTIFLKEGIELTYNAYVKSNYQFGIDWGLKVIQTELLKSGVKRMVLALKK